MIHKIERLASIGKFRNYQATGDVAFRKLTLIYGDNGSGKTTLTAILRSLTLNNTEFVRRRKSTNHATIQQAAQIISRQAGAVNTFHTFNHSTGWGTAYPHLEIFDVHFVNENIYSGFDFNDEHKKRLHQFVIGAQGVAIQQQIEQNKAAKTASRQAQTAIEQQIIDRVGTGLNVGDIGSFLGISNDEANNIDTRIAAAEAALVSAKTESQLPTGTMRKQPDQALLDELPWHQPTL